MIHHANQLLTQAVVLLTHEASKLESIPHSHALKHWSFIVQNRNSIYRSVEVELCYYKLYTWGLF